MNLKDRVLALAASRGFGRIDFTMDVVMQDDGDGRGAYIASWSNAYGQKPTTMDGFSQFELHKITGEQNAD